MTKQVLITRAPERAKDLIRELGELGISGEAIAVTRTEFVVDLNAVLHLSEFSWLAFTSANGVRGFQNWLKARNRRLPEGLRIAVVGRATGTATTRIFHRPELVAKTPTGQGLAKELTLLMDSSEQRLLWACSTKPRPEFTQELLDAKIKVTSLPVYATIAVDPQQLSAKLADLHKYEAVVFAAPSAVQAFCAAVSKREQLTCVAIGETTAGAARKCGFKEVYASPRPEPEDLAKTIHKALTGRNRD